LNISDFFIGDFELNLDEFNFIYENVVLKNEFLQKEIKNKGIILHPLCVENLDNNSFVDLWNKFNYKDKISKIDITTLIIPYVFKNNKFAYFEIIFMPSIKNKYSILIKCINPKQIENSKIENIEKNIKDFFDGLLKTKPFRDDIKCILAYDINDTYEGVEGTSFCIIDSIVKYIKNPDYKFNSNFNLKALREIYIKKLPDDKIKTGEILNKQAIASINKLCTNCKNIELNSEIYVSLFLDYKKEETRSLEDKKNKENKNLKEKMEKNKIIDIESKELEIIKEETMEDLRKFNKINDETKKIEYNNSIQDELNEIKNKLKENFDFVREKIKNGYITNNHNVNCNNSDIIEFIIKFSDQNRKIIIQQSEKDKENINFIFMKNKEEKEYKIDFELLSNDALTIIKFFIKDFELKNRGESCEFIKEEEYRLLESQFMGEIINNPQEKVDNICREQSDNELEEKETIYEPVSRPGSPININKELDVGQSLKWQQIEIARQEKTNVNNNDLNHF